VPTICSCWNVVFLGLHTRTWPSTGFDKCDFHPTSALSSTTWYSIPYGHVPIEAWQFCGVLSVADVLSLSSSTKPCAVKTSIDDSSANAPVDNPLASQRVCSAEW
jgi:hypothetical protein